MSFGVNYQPLFFGKHYIKEEEREKIKKREAQGMVIQLAVLFFLLLACTVHMALFYTYFSNLL